MKIQFHIFLIFLLVVHFGCKNSTEPNNNRSKVTTTVTMSTDSLQYNLMSGISRVAFRIHNYMDSTLVFPSCGMVSTRIDMKQRNIWLIGYPGWNSACLGIYYPYTFLEKDSSTTDYVFIDSVGTYRIVTIYGFKENLYLDTLISNEFIVQ